MVSQLVDAVVMTHAARGACPVEEDFMEAFAAFSFFSCSTGRGFSSESVQNSGGVLFLGSNLGLPFVPRELMAVA